MACAAAGFIMGTITLTGLGVKLTSYITLVAGDSLFLGLVFTMVASLDHGNGYDDDIGLRHCPAVLCVPALVNLGADLIAAHFFVLYFGMLSKHNATDRSCRHTRQRRSPKPTHGEPALKHSGSGFRHSFCPSRSSMLPNYSCGAR